MVVKLNNGIKAINKYINIQVDALTQREEASSDRMTNMFKSIRGHPRQRFHSIHS
jgi:hypothetical protein